MGLVPIACAQLAFSLMNVVLELLDRAEPEGRKIPILQVCRSNLHLRPSLGISSCGSRTRPLLEIALTIRLSRFIQILAVRMGMTYLGSTLWMLLTGIKNVRPLLLLSRRTWPSPAFLLPSYSPLPVEACQPLVVKE